MAVTVELLSMECFFAEAISYKCCQYMFKKSTSDFMQIFVYVVKRKWIFFDQNLSIAWIETLLKMMYRFMLFKNYYCINCMMHGNVKTNTNV